MAEKWNAIRFRCTVCDGIGTYPGENAQTCPGCNGTGYTNSRLETDVTEILDKIQELKTKINQMQADINYIKAKVG